MKYHYPTNRKYSEALCGADVPWHVLAMNSDMVTCKNCIRLAGIADEKHGAELNKCVDSHGTA